jgi:hypothetical protein
LPTFNYRSANWANDWAIRTVAFSVVVTGAHSMKFGYEGTISWRTSRTTGTTSTSPISSTVAPLQLTEEPRVFKQMDV